MAAHVGIKGEVVGSRNASAHVGGFPMKALSWINFLLGVWLTIAAFALPARTGPTMAAEGVAGVMIAVLAYASAVGRPNAGISWSVAVAGLWTLVVNYGLHTAATSNATIVGLVVLVLGSTNAIYRHTPKRTGT
jgi:hypothetical protein